jgi:TRAP-type transport system periplasmic protein
VLRLANTNGRLDFTPAVDYFARRVEELSGGNLRVDSVDAWGNSAPDAEQGVVRAVSAGDVDLGWVGTRIFDTLGVNGFQALTAPMLVDSYALQDAVIESGITDEMMEDLDRLDVAGLGVVADGLRRPIGVRRPILGSADWRGIAFGTLRSHGQAAAIRALGATPVQVQWEEREARLANGTLDGFETSLWTHQHNPALAQLAPYVTSNVTLWPQMDVLLANPARLEGLTAKQRGWLEEAARDAATRSAALADKDAKALADACKAGARFAEASAADLAALEAAFAPVYAKLEREPRTKDFVERIRALKAPTRPDARLTIPSECAGKAPKRVAGGTTSGTNLNGTYRFVLTQEDADKAGDLDSGYPHVETITLRDGRLDGGCFGAAGGTYSADEHRITFHSIEYGGSLTVTYSQNDHGDLRLIPVPPMDPGNAFTCFYKHWIRIDGGAASSRAAGGTQTAAAELNGTYRYVLTRKDAQLEVPEAPDLDTYPQVNTWTLRDGRYANPGGLEGRYSVKGNRITFDVPDFGYDFTFTFSVDGAGNLRLRAVPPMDPGDRFVWSYKVWKKIR